ncbi:ASCH domain-containing protein [Catenulispora subtropica]
MTPDEAAGLPVTAFAFPGPLRDQLNAAILDGSKTSTTSLVLEYRLADEPFPEPGRRSVVIDSAGEPIAVIETTEVRFARVGAVDLEHAVAEGEGYTSVAEWRAGHEDFWHGDAMRENVGDPEFTVDDDTEAVLERFRVVALIAG